jgi:outer membrane biosynthesis protein TonB
MAAMRDVPERPRETDSPVAARPAPTEIAPAPEQHALEPAPALAPPTPAAQVPPPVVAAQTDTPPPAPTPPVVVAAATPAPAPAPAPAPTFEAQVGFRGLTVRGSLPATSVRTMLDRSASQLRGCYRDAARARGSDASADVGVRFSIDENGAIRGVTTDGGGAIASCVQGVVSRLRPRDRPDIGFIQVSLTVHFTPVRGTP